MTILNLETKKNFLDLPVQLPNDKENIFNTLKSQLKEETEQVENTLRQRLITDIGEKYDVHSIDKYKSPFCYTGNEEKKNDFFQEFPQIKDILNKMNYNNMSISSKKMLKREFLDVSMCIYLSLYFPEIFSSNFPGWIQHIKRAYLYEENRQKENIKELIEKNLKKMEHAKMIDIGKNNFGTMKINEFKLVTQGLRQANEIQLSKNEIGTMDIEKLQILMQAIRYTKVLELEENKIGTMNKDKMKIFLEGIQHARVIGFSMNDLGSMDKNTLPLFIKGIQNAKIIDFQNNNLNKMQKDEFKMFIQGLKNAKVINVCFNYFDLRQKKIIKKELSDKGIIVDIRI